MWLMPGTRSLRNLLVRLGISFLTTSSGKS